MDVQLAFRVGLRNHNQEYPRIVELHLSLAIVRYQLILP